MFITYATHYRDYRDVMGCECGMQVKVKQLGATSGAKEQQENSDIRLLHRYAYAVPSNVL